MQVIIPMAGLGSRFQNTEFTQPKPLIDVNGTPMIKLAIETLGISGTYNFIVRNNEYFTETISIIDSICHRPNILTVNDTTEGAAVSALMFENLIDHDDELIIANCDQVMNWDSNVMLDYLRQFDCGVVTTKSNDQKHSYVNIENDKIVFREKEVISDNALVGIHYWKRAGYFFDSANKMIKNNDRSKNGEFYVAPTYNYLNLSVGLYEVADNEFKPIGTPDDLRKYLNDCK
jgi:NDP-sugar pyrophosphorylase family protein